MQENPKNQSDLPKPSLDQLLEELKENSLRRQSILERMKIVQATTKPIKGQSAEKPDVREELPEEEVNENPIQSEAKNEEPQQQSMLGWIKEK